MKKQEDHCYYSGLPSPMAYTKKPKGKGKKSIKKDKDHKNTSKIKWNEWNWICSTSVWNSVINNSDNSRWLEKKK